MVEQKQGNGLARQLNDSTLVEQFLSKKGCLFADLTRGELRELVSRSVLRRFHANQLIFSRGDPGDGLYVILEGRVGVRTISLDGKEVILNILEGGEILGEIAVIDGKERTAGAGAMEKTDLLYIERDAFMEFLGRHPTLSLKVLEIVCGRLRWTSSIIEDAYFRDVRSRLARRLLNLAKNYGLSSEQGISLRIRLSQDELGRMLGVTRESISKEMGVLQRQGIVSIKHASITVHDIGKLEELAASF